MKKVLFTMLVLLGIASSCTTEDEQNVQTDKANVCFELDVETVLKTRAISDGQGATQLMYGIFNEDGEVVVSKVVIDNAKELQTSSGYSMNISLAKGQSYNAVFWAQNPNCDAYTVTDDMKLTVNYDGLNNDELRDAFYAVTEKFTVEGNKTVSVVLRRPFAQVNVGAFPYDFEHAKEMGLDIATSSATFKNMPNQLDMLTGVATGDVEVNYSLNAIPTETLNVDVDEDGNNETYTYLSMSYILANATSTTHEMEFVFAEADGGSPADFKTVDMSEGLHVVPIQRNWRTNIVGQILSGNVSFNVKIDPIYEKETLHSAGLYYNFSNDVYIKDKVFAFNTSDAATFTSQNNTLISLENVTFSGKVEQIAIGEYRDKGNYVSFTNELKNVTAKNMVVTHPIGIANVEPIDYMAPLFFLRGENKVTDCTFTGATSIAPDRGDYNGDYHEVIAYDCGVPNKCSAVFENCEIGKLYAWSHSQITLKNTKVDYIRCSTHKWSNSASHLTIDSGTEVNEISVSSSGLAKFVTIDGKKTLTAELWAPSLIIKAGAKVKRLDMNGRLPYRDITKNGEMVRTLSVIIEDGAIIEEIVNAADEIPNAPTN